MKQVITLVQGLFTQERQYASFLKVVYVQGLRKMTHTVATIFCYIPDKCFLSAVNEIFLQQFFEMLCLHTTIIY
jgi:hypothetical protein